ncbi:SpaA isopeptide-forming pilin-related protein [Oribacterium sp. P9]|uniref:SpaA isopeptide-forming pilin-related protein n=1 Tax=Oribacterium sp. P9 TaxID=3378068 RepID=UPI003967DC4E
MKDLAKRGLVGLLTVSMCLSNVQGIAFADNRVEVGGVKVDGKKVTLNLNGGSLMEAARAALAEANVYDDTYIAISKDAKTQAAYRALTDGSNPLYELALFSDGELQALEDAGVEIVALIQMDQKQAEAAGNLMPATASEIERSSTKVEFFDPSKDEGKEILLYQPDSLFAGFYDQFSNQLMNASEKEIASADPSTYELSGDEKVTFLFINHADAGRTFNLELNGESLEKGIKVAKAESVIKGVMSTLDVSGIDETLETPAPETSAATETGAAATEPSSEATAQPSEEAATQPSTETAIEPSTEASGTAGESIVILPETGATVESGETETSAAVEPSAAQPSQDEANAETGLPTEGQTSTENTEQPAAEKTTAPAENTGIVDTIKEVIETIAENANATMMKIERRLGVIRAEAAENDETVADAPKSEEAPAAGTENEAPKPAETPAAGTENEAPKPAETPAAGTENEAPKPAETPAAGTENEAPKPEETPAAGTGIEAPKPEETPATGTENEAPKPEETPAADSGIEAPKTEETTAAAEIETTAAVKTDMDIALENDRKALLRETRAADLVDASVASARVLQYTLDDLSKSFWSAEITDRYEVNVFAEDNAFTEAVELELKELAKPEEAEDGTLAVGEDTLNEKQVEALKADGVYENSQSLDIRFVNAAGEEVEPSSAVKVRIKVYKEALPEDADISTMAIRHLDEKSADAVNVDTVAEYREDATSDHGTIKPVDVDGKVTELQTVDSENADEKTAAIAETATESKKVLPEEAVAVESTFTVNSFSGFTITFGTQTQKKEATVEFIYTDSTGTKNEGNVKPNAELKDITEEEEYKDLKEFDFSKYAADKDNDKKYTFKEVRLAKKGVEFKKSTLIDNKLKKVEQNGEETKWQYTTITKTEGGKLEKGETKDLEDNDTIYVVYTQGIKLTTVETVDSAKKGFKLYMTDFKDKTRFTSGGYKPNDGSLTQGLYSSPIEPGSFPTLITRDSYNGRSLSTWCGTSTEVNKLFIKSVYDETGYFYYNSAEYFATRASRNDNKTTIGTNFTVYNQLGSPSDENRFYYKRGNFLPFNTLNTSNILTNRNLFDDTGAELKVTDPRYNEALYGLNETVNFYFGLYGVADFYQPVGGQVNGDDMIFEFTGDDDMVVYIDGVLVLDLGGVHDAQSGSINFATGEVKYTNRKQGESLTWNRHTIHDKFAAANKLDTTRWKDEKTFADGTQHKIQIFYMERGAGASNLKIKVNIPPIPDGSVNITKTVDGLDTTQAAEEEYTLTLLKNGEVAKHQAFTRSGKTGTTYWTNKDDGTFKIKADETVNFDDIPKGTKIQVLEVDKGQIYEVTYEAYNSNNQKLDENNATVPSAGYVKVEVKNNATVNTRELTIYKKFKTFKINGETSTAAPNGEKFKEATFTLQEKNYGAPDTSYQDLHTVKYSAFTNGSYTFYKLDPRKTYRVVENISTETPDTNGGTGEIPYVKTTYMVGSGTTAVDGTTSGDIALGTMGTDGRTFAEFFSNTVTFTNEYHSRKADIQFTKVDADDTTKKLTGAEFTLYEDSVAATPFHREGSTDAVTATSNDAGLVEFTNLPYNITTVTTYYIKETKAPAGYVTNGKIYKVTIAGDGAVSMAGDGQVGTMTIITNKAIETELTFYKKSKTKNGTEISLDGAVFEIKRLEGSEYKPVTGIEDVDSDGRFTIPTDGIKLTHLLDGTYQLTEITAPAGYNLLTDPITFVIENGQLKNPENVPGVVTFDSTAKEVYIYNTAGIQLPETGGMGTLMTTMSGMALMLIALGYLILVKRREKGGLN